MHTSGESLSAQLTINDVSMIIYAAKDKGM